jgi:hypothetical protein
MIRHQQIEVLLKKFMGIRLLKQNMTKSMFVHHNL